jgi:SAM-dependent methyltransferase
VTSRLPDAYFDTMYVASADPWELRTRWYEQRKYAITLSVLPRRRYRHAFEPGCSIGTLTERLTERCDVVTATDVAVAALRGADLRLRQAGLRERVLLMKLSLDQPWPAGDFDLVVLSEVGYYLQADTLRAVLDRERRRLADATVVAAHWRHPVADYPIPGDQANEIIGATKGLHLIGSYRDVDVAIDVFDTASAGSVAARDGVPGAAEDRPDYLPS